MTEQELREKIVEILVDNFESIWQSIWLGYRTGFNAGQIADALIAAGIGDVSELRNHRVVAEYSLIPEDGNSYVLPNTPLRVKQLYSGEEVEKIVKERDEYKHRAEVAERALNFLCNSIMKDYDILVFKDGTKIKNKIELYDYCVKQAEREIKEEKGE